MVAQWPRRLTSPAYIYTPVARSPARAPRSTLTPIRSPVRHASALMATAVASASSASATEQTEGPQLAELISPQAGLTSDIELKVIRNEIINYSYKSEGVEVSTQKVQVLLQSKIADQYCLGVAKLQKKDKAELKKIQDRFQTDTTWKFKTIKHISEKPAFIHTTCRITVDLRKSQAQAVLQSTSFPEAPVPTCTIADILQLKQMQRFDLMAIPAAIIDERQSGAGMRIADVRLVDGSRHAGNTATEHEYASLPLTLFFKSEAEFVSFKNNIGHTPVLFMSLSGNRKEGKVQVTTVKDQTWWQPAAGTKCVAMAGDAAEICGDGAVLADVSSLPVFQPQEAIDYTSPMATLTACRLVDPTSTTPSDLLGDATEHLYQLNHVYVVPPSKTDTIKTHDDRLFAQLDCWDYSQKITLAFRSKALLQLAQIADGQAQEYEDQLGSEELRHPLLASLRLHIKSKTPAPGADASMPSQTQRYNVLSAVVVETMPCTFTDIPNDAVEAIHGLLGGRPQTSERLTAVPLDKLQPSPFYNMLADGEPTDKALTLLRFTQRGNGKQLANGFRIVTERVQDATADAAIEHTNANQYATACLCTVEKAPDFLPAKDTTAIAVISKVVAAGKPQHHAADLYIEAMEVVPKSKIADSVEMMRQLYRVSDIHHGNASTSSETAYQQRKCRRLLRYPTQS